MGESARRPREGGKVQDAGNGIEWCARQDLNLHALRHYHLKVARLPIPPRARDLQPTFIMTMERHEADGRGGEIRTHDLLYPKQAR